MALEEVLSCIADPCFNDDGVAENGGVLIIDLVAGDDEDNGFFPVRLGVLIPMIDRGVLEPLHINKIAYVIKHVDVFRSDRNCHVIWFVGGSC